MDYKEHYRIDAQEFDYWGADQFSPTELRRNQTIFDLARVKSAQKVLDIGSGRGWFSLHAAARGANVTALDLSETNLARIKSLDGRIDTIYGDAGEPPISDKKFDLIVALEVLEHLTDPQLAINNWKSLLSPKGRLLISVPYREKLRYELCIHCHQKTPLNAHLHSFDLKTLSGMLCAAGLILRSTHLFLHKLLPHFYLDKLTLRLPYTVWQSIDNLCRFAGDKYSYMAMISSIK